MAPAPFHDTAVNVVDDDDDESQIDMSDLDAQYAVKLEEGLDTFVVVDGLPIVTEEQKDKLINFIYKKLQTAGKVDKADMFMPIGENGKSEGFAFVEYRGNPEAAATAVRTLSGQPLDKKHIMWVNKLTDIEKIGKLPDEYEEPHIPPFEEKEHLRSWIGDLDCRDQFIMHHNENVGVYWNERDDPPEQAIDRLGWTDTYASWSPQGTYLTTMHAKGIQLWGGPSWSRQKRISHPGVNLLDFSPNENYLVTWSHIPLRVEGAGDGQLTEMEDGKNYIIWDLATGKPIRSFVNIDPPGPSTDAEGNPIKKKMIWPAFKWSCDDKYVARMTPAQSVSVYELPRMNILDKTAVKIEGIMDFEWAPAPAQRDGIKTPEQLFCFWTPESGSIPAKVGLMSIPSREIVRTRNLFNVADAKLHWQSDAKYVCCKVDLQKTKRSLKTDLEIFRIREKGIPVEVVDTVKDHVINFKWEPKGDRFVLITEPGDLTLTPAAPQKTTVWFFAPEKTKTGTAGNFRVAKVLEKRNCNSIYWAPKGRFVVIATVMSGQSYEMEFWDFDYEGEKEDKDKDKELSANLQLMNTAEHYNLTDIEWDPTGRYVVSGSSMWRNAMETGYHIYDFKGTLLRDEHVDRFKQITWRPRPPTLLSKDEQKQVRRTLREYSKTFDEQDHARKTTADKAVVEQRRRLLDEWIAWREQVVTDLREQRREMGLPEEEKNDAEDEVKTIEEIKEEILQEKEEVVE